MRTGRTPEVTARQRLAPPHPDRPVPIGTLRRCWERPRSPRACCGFGDRCVCAPLSPPPRVAPSQRSLREGCHSDEGGHACHHRERCGRPGAQGGGPGNRRQPGAGPDRLPRSAPARRRPYYAWPTVAVVLAGSFTLSVWRVGFQPLVRRRSRLPKWPASPSDDTPSLVIGELHHPTAPKESERPSWLVIPEKGLYTGVLIVGAVGTGKTTACMRCGMGRQSVTGHGPR